MRSIAARACALLAGAVIATPALAQDASAPVGDPVAGRKVATAICQACHGLNGLPMMPEMPVIAGSDATYLYNQLLAYKSGARENDSMSAVGPMLDNQKAANVAAYYASVKVEATPP